LRRGSVLGRCGREWEKQKESQREEAAHEHVPRSEILRPEAEYCINDEVSKGKGVRVVAQSEFILPGGVIPKRGVLQPRESLP
jgi:hypothetical protein